MSDETDLDAIEAFNNATFSTGREILARCGFVPPEPEEMDEYCHRGRLWEILYALAARRFFFFHTDHLDDEELLEWIHGVWLDDGAADLEPRHGWNCRVDVAGGSTGSPEGQEIYLKYYATDEEREQQEADFPEVPLPPRAEMPHDRDRWMPEPPLPEPMDVETEDDLMPFDTDDEEDSDEEGDEDEEEGMDDDPLGLNEVDREIRSERRRLEASADDEPEGMPQDALLDEDSVGNENWQKPMDSLQRSGVVLPPPDELTDETIGAKLWELLHELACRGFFVKHTDHLADREVYSTLWRDSLHEPAILSGRSRTGAWFHDFVGSGSDEANQIWLRYHATEEERTSHAERWPDDPMPPRETPPVRRDWRLPQGPFGN